MENIREIIQNLKDKTTAAENKIQKFEQEIEIKTQEKYELMRNSSNYQLLNIPIVNIYKLKYIKLIKI